VELLKYNAFRKNFKKKFYFLERLEEGSRVRQRENNVGTNNDKSGQKRLSLIVLCVIYEGLPRVYQENMN